MKKLSKKPEPSLAELQKEWYAKLAESGFEDIEDTSQPDRPLKSWTAEVSLTSKNEEIDLIDQFIHQPAEIENENMSSIITAMPEPLHNSEEKFTSHEEFKKICDSLTKHGNSKLSSEDVKSIWNDHCEGLSSRVIAKKHNVNKEQIRRMLGKLKQWMNFLGE